MIYTGISVFSRKPVELQTEGTKICSVKNIDTPEKLPYISPGFLDMQVNGYNGNDYSLEDLSLDGIKSIIESLAVSGTARHVPTIVTSPQKLLLRNLKVIKDAVEKYPEIAASIAGIHIEGPYISPEDGPRGAHDPEYIRNPDINEFSEWQKISGNRIAIVTLAPERKGAFDFIRAITLKGTIASIGHTGAAPEQIREAVLNGAELSTHLGNGSHAVMPRLKNYIWEQLASDELYAGIITDGFHLPAPVVKVFTRAKGLNRLILVSDTALSGGRAPGIYKWGNIDVEVHKDGHLGLAGTPYLAGAGHLLDWDIAHFVSFTGAALADAIRLCTINPARLLKLRGRFLKAKVLSGLPCTLPEKYGKLEAGAPADITIFTCDETADKPEEHNIKLNILKTVINGKEVYSA